MSITVLSPTVTSARSVLIDKSSLGIVRPSLRRRQANLTNIKKFRAAHRSSRTARPDDEAMWNSQAPAREFVPFEWEFSWRLFV